MNKDAPRMTAELRKQLREARDRQRRQALAKSLTAHRSLDRQVRNYLERVR